MKIDQRVYVETILDDYDSDRPTLKIVRTTTRPCRDDPVYNCVILGGLPIRLPAIIGDEKLCVKAAEQIRGEAINQLVAVLGERVSDIIMLRKFLRIFLLKSKNASFWLPYLDVEDWYDFWAKNYANFIAITTKKGDKNEQL